MTTIETRRQQEYERFEESRRFEESTDIAERLGYPIDTTISYRLKEDALYAVTDTVDRPFHAQTLKAKLASHRFEGDQAFERVRLSHEHDEALLADALGRDQLDGNVMVVLSKIPDAVVTSATSINGYRRDLLRSFVRIYQQTETGVECRLFTLDHNHPEGMRRVGKLLGINTDVPSEDILADRQIMEVSEPIYDFVDALANQIKSEYDAAIHAETGRLTHAGSEYGDRFDAQSAVLAQRDLFEEHMAALTQIVGTSREAQRERTAAAIKMATEGIFVESIADSSVSREVESGNFGGECATATNGMNQAAQVMENVWTHGECQVCFAKTMVGSCMICARCAKADDQGVDLLKMRDENIRRRKTATHMATTSLRDATVTKQSLRPVSTDQLIAAQYGTKAHVQKRNTIGGAVRDIFVEGKLVGTI